LSPFELHFDNYYDVQNRQGIWLSAFNMPPHRDPKIEQFITKLFNWSSKYRLEAPWCREFAYETLDLWSQSALYKTAGIWWYTTALVTPSHGHRRGNELVMLMRHFKPSPQEFIFKRVTLFPLQGFRAEVTKSITDQFKMQLEAFLDRSEEQAKDAKLVRSIRKDTDKHVKWLAKFQINEEEYSEISNGLVKAKRVTSSLRGGYSSDHNKKVRQAINKLAQLIDLPLRLEPRFPGRRGKRKSKDL